VGERGDWRWDGFEEIREGQCYDRYCTGVL